MVFILEGAHISLGFLFFGVVVREDDVIHVVEDVLLVTGWYSHVDIFIYMGIDEGIDGVELYEFEIEVGSNSDNCAKRTASEYRGINFLPSFLRLLVSTNNESRFNLIETTVLKVFIYIYLYIIEELFIILTWFITVDFHPNLYLNIAL